MPTSKVTFFINAAVQQNTPGATGTDASAGATTRVGGISESYYSTLTWNSTELFFVGNAYANNRAKLLPNVCAIVATRYQEVGSKGKSLLSMQTYPGSADTIGDIPQMALRTKVHSRTSGAERGIVLGAIPDARVQRGSYNPSQAFTNNLANLLLYIKGNFLMRAIDQTVPTYPLVSISAAGVVTTEGVTPIANGDIVQVQVARDSKYRARGGYFKVTAAAGLSTFFIEKWDGGACTGGKVRKHVVAYEPVDVYTSDIVNPKATVRKFGRPFDLFRGRASTKR